MQVTADQMSLVLENARLYNKVDDYGKALNHELEKGRQIQLDFLPDKILQPSDWEITACFQPAKQVAGDFYDVFQLGDYVGLVIADVCDKGVGAALFMALMRSLIRIFSGQTQLRGFSVVPHEQLVKGLDQDSDFFKIKQLLPLEAVLLTNNYVAEVHWQMSMFATMFFGVLDPKNGALSYINGGHEPLFVLNNHEIKQVLKSTGPAVGMMPDQTFKIQQIHLEPGDILFGYTDGVTEAKNPDGKLFGEDNVRQIILQDHPSASELLDSLKKRLFEYIDDAAQFDDITMIAVQRKF
jgi:sigma-B regulation protein RsbU (phosphoserine phosphatase)